MSYRRMSNAVARAAMVGFSLALSAMSSGCLVGRSMEIDSTSRSPWFNFEFAEPKKKADRTLQSIRHNVSDRWRDFRRTSDVPTGVVRVVANIPPSPRTGAPTNRSDAATDVVDSSSFAETEGQIAAFYDSDSTATERPERTALRELVQADEQGLIEVDVDALDASAFESIPITPLEPAPVETAPSSGSNNAPTPQPSPFDVTFE